MPCVHSVRLSAVRAGRVGATLEGRAFDGWTPTVIAAFSVTPLGAGDSVGDVVAECVRIVRNSGLANETNSMFTNIEGDYDDVMAVIKSCVDHVAALAPRVSVVVKMDIRNGEEPGRMAAKVATVERSIESTG